MSSSPGARQRSAIRRDPARFGKLLAGLASDQPVPAGGSASAAAVAMAAALVEKAAKLSVSHWSDAVDAARRAESLKVIAIELIDLDASAYSKYVGLLRATRGIDATTREKAVAPLRSFTVQVPLLIVRSAAGVVGLACALAQSGNPNLRSDALVACTLAVAGAQSALITMSANLPVASHDPRLAEARRLVRMASSRLRLLPARGPADARGRVRGRSRGNQAR